MGKEKERLTKEERLLAAFTALYVFAFTAFYISVKNYEFLWYAGVLVFFFGLIFATLHRSRFPAFTLWGLSVWGFLHMAGGGVIINGETLYKLHIISIAGSGDAFVLRFDQLVHFFGFAVATLVVYHLLTLYLKPDTNWKVVYPLVVSAGMGLGALNEIAEFMAVLVFPIQAWADITTRRLTWCSTASARPRRSCLST